MNQHTQGGTGGTPPTEPGGRGSGGDEPDIIPITDQALRLAGIEVARVAADHVRRAYLPGPHDHMTVGQEAWIEVFGGPGVASRQGEEVLEAIRRHMQVDVDGKVVLPPSVRERVQDLAVSIVKKCRAKERHRVTRRILPDDPRDEPRKVKVRLHPDQSLGDHDWDVAAPEDEGSRNLRRLYQALSRLSGEVRAVMVLSYIERRPARVIAEMTGLKPHCVYEMRRKGMRVLANVIDELPDPGGSG